MTAGNGSFKRGNHAALEQIGRSWHLVDRRAPPRRLERESREQREGPEHNQSPAVLPPLCQSIDPTPIGHLVYLVTGWRQPHSSKTFGNWFKKQCRETGLEVLSAHGLRKLGAQRCDEARASEHQLMALFGWTNPQQAALYTRKANRAKLEAAAEFFQWWRPKGIRAPVTP
jgi:integrase